MSLFSRRINGRGCRFSCCGKGTCVLLLRTPGSAAALELGLRHRVRNHAADGGGASSQTERGELVVEDQNAHDDHHHALQRIAQRVCDRVDNVERVEGNLVVPGNVTKGGGRRGDAGGGGGTLKSCILRSVRYCPTNSQKFRRNMAKKKWRANQPMQARSGVVNSTLLRCILKRITCPQG